MIRPNKVETAVQCFRMSRASVRRIFWSWKFSSQYYNSFKGVHTFPKINSSKKKAPAQVQFELGYYEFAAQEISNYTPEDEEIFTLNSTIICYISVYFYS